MPIKIPTNKTPVPSLAPALWTPEFLVADSAWIEHTPFAFWLVDVLRPRHFVELGARSGYSYFCFCQAIQRLSLGTNCHAVDTWAGDERASFYGEEIFQSVAAHNDRYSAFSTLLRTTFDDACDYFPAKSIDLLHIDGRYFYDDVRHDFETWRSKLTDDAIVLFHDTNVRERDAGVWRLFDELKREYATFEFMDGRGLGALAVKDAPSALKPLFDADQATADQWRLAFASLSRNIREMRGLRESEAQLRAGERDPKAAHDLEAKSAHQLADELARARDEIKRLGSIRRRNVAWSLAARGKLKANSEAVLALEAKALALEAKAALMVGKRAAAGSLVRRTVRMRRKQSRLEKLWMRIRSALQPKKANLAILRRSLFFDKEWYLATYPDVAMAKMDPAKHYLARGAREERDPGPLFSTRSYLANNPDVGQKKLNPLLHFETRGWREGGRLFVEDMTDIFRVAIRRHIANLPYKPLISVIMPVYDPPIEYLRRAIGSVTRQSYPNWELCVANDASTNPEIARVLDSLAGSDRRIRVVHREQNGNICVASNSALSIAEGDFVALMDHDDLLHETALYEVVSEINAYPNADIIYTDEDKIDEHDRHFDFYFKPDFNPELFLGQNIINHLCVFRRCLIQTLGGFRLGYEGSQDFDLALRAWAASSIDRIRHIPAVLYHWRQGTQVATFSEARLEQCTTAARSAIQEFLDREGEDAGVVPAPKAPSWSRILRQIPKPEPLVSVIVLTKDRADLMSVCADGVLNKTDYPNLELLIVDHESKEARSHDLFEILKRDARVRILPYQGQFNFSAMNNVAASVARGTVLALVNNDIEILSPDWLNEMVSFAVRPDIGAVGAKLYYPDGRIQHAGVVIGLGGIAGHSFLFEKRGCLGYFGQAMLTRAVSAVTGACLVVRKSVFLEVNGLDADAFPVAFNDVDFCLRVQAKGYRNVWTPFAELIHHESLSRGYEDTPEKKDRFARECVNFRGRWSSVIENDPFYNPNLSLQSHRSEVADVSRRILPWSGYL